MTDETRKIAEGIVRILRRRDPLIVSINEPVDFIAENFESYGQKRFEEGMRKAMDIVDMEIESQLEPDNYEEPTPPISRHAIDALKTVFFNIKHFLSKEGQE